MTKISYCIIGMEFCIFGIGIALIFHNYSAMIPWGMAALWAYIAYRLEKLLDEIVTDLRKIVKENDSRKVL